MINLDDKIRKQRMSDCTKFDTQYRCYCDVCGKDRGYLSKRRANLLCRSCQGKVSHQNVTLETRKKMSDAKQNIIPWNKGKRGVTNATRQKMRDAKLRYTPYNKGKTMTLEQRIKLSCSSRDISVENFDNFKSSESKRGRDQITKLQLNIKCFQNANYTCDIYGTIGCSLHAHHKNSWVHFPEQRYDIKNLVCISKDAHKVFHSIYGNGKLKPITALQYDNFKAQIAAHRQRKQDLYLITGVSGSGKTHICQQLQDKFYYVSYDRIPRWRHIYELLMGNNQQLLFDISIGVSTFIKRYRHLFNIHLIIINEPESVIIQRLRKRNGNITDKLTKRIQRMQILAKNAEFTGTSLEVFNYLKFI
jgi:hypothetical protein